MANQRYIKGAKIPDDMDVAAIRLNTTCPGHCMPYTQENFGRLLGVPTATLRQWEQGRRKPTGAARVLLSLIERNPRLVVETLREKSG